MKIIVSNRSDIPIYEQIKEQIKTAILTNQIKEGEILPSIRQLARDLGVSVITTTRAYNDLEDEGFIVSVQGKGSYVLPQNKELVRENALLEIEEYLVSVIKSAKLADISLDEIVTTLKILAGEDK